ncbi:MAG: type II toxin-antitoxin system HicA family toxin [Methylococcaceae bacterium]
MIELDGWQQVRQKGSHRQFHHPVKSGTVKLLANPAWMFRLGRLSIF